MTPTFRVSEVETYRQWRDDEDADMETLLERMRGQWPATEAMLAGTAFHAALEAAMPGADFEVLEAEGFEFTFADDFEIGLTPIREIRASKVYTVDGENVAITGQLDAIHGNRIEDHKTTGRFDPERYLSGYQWRLYLEIFHAQQFRWNVFEIAVTDDPRIWLVKTAHTLEQFRYPGMDADCEALVTELVRFAREHLPERFALSVAA